MNKNRLYIFIILIFLFITLSISRLIYLNVYQSSYYNELLLQKTNRIVSGNSAPRGRILDRNGNILVDNIGVKTIVYSKLNSFTLEDEIEIAQEIAKLLTLEKEATISELKEYWIITNKQAAQNLVTIEEYQALEERKLTQNDLNQLTRDRINETHLNSLTLQNQKEALIYSLMNKGYGWEKKIIKSKNVSEAEYATVIENKIKGITGELTWERTYPYDNLLRSIFGTISTAEMGLPLENQEYYINQGYSLNDRVGISYLEKQYEKYLKGEKDLYYINNDNTLSLYKEGSRGNDIVLSIDINIQKEIENIIEEEITYTKTLKNTEYYDHSYVIISDPNNGSIIAASGKKINNNQTFTDITNNIINSTYTMGSVVKGASMTVGYQNNLIDINSKIYDSCVKLYNVPEKCSNEKLGYINDISALTYSSNYYQFLLAISLSGQHYTRGMKFITTEDDFNKYRQTFTSFGLGGQTGIDLPNEQNGIYGKTIAGDLLLNLAIGNYDTYTPIELMQYINTIANDGIRTTPGLMLQILDNSGKIITAKDNTPLNHVDIESKYLKRIQQGFKEVLSKGTGRGYTDLKYQPAGKTGTSQSFIDSNNDGTSDTQTVSSSYAMYAPYDDPKYSMIVLSPHIYHNNNNSDYFSWTNRRISKKVSDFLFENY